MTFSFWEQLADNMASENIKHNTQMRQARTDQIARAAVALANSRGADEADWQAFIERTGEEQHLLLRAVESIESCRHR